MNEWLQEFGPVGVFFAVSFALLKWLLHREFKRFEAQQQDYESRIRRLEDSRVTRADMDELRMSLMASMNLVHSDLTRSMGGVQADIRVLTEHLLGRK